MVALEKFLCLIQKSPNFEAKVTVLHLVLWQLLEEVHLLQKTNVGLVSRTEQSTLQVLNSFNAHTFITLYRLNFRLEYSELYDPRESCWDGQ